MNFNVITINFLAMRVDSLGLLIKISEKELPRP